jgi:hypothetical protein
MESQITLAGGKMKAFLRNSLVVLALLANGAAHLPASAQSLSAPFVVYDNELKNGWQNWSWAKVDMAALSESVKPFKVEGGPWSALALHHDPFATGQFSKLTFYVHGGAEGGQRLSVKVMADGKPVDASYMIQPKARAWAIVEVPLKDLAAENRTIDGLVLQGDDAAYKPYYITRIQFE